MEGSFYCQVTAIVTWMEAIKMGEWEMMNEELLGVLPPILESLRSFELIQVFAGLESLVKRDPCNIEKLREVGIINAIKEFGDQFSGHRNNEVRTGILQYLGYPRRNESINIAFVVQTICFNQKMEWMLHPV
jgi:hypothetical protein